MRLIYSCFESILSLGYEATLIFIKLKFKSRFVKIKNLIVHLMNFFIPKINKITYPTNYKIT